MSALYWAYHLFWLLGKFYLALLHFDKEKAREALCFIWLHLAYPPKLISWVHKPFKTEYKNYLIGIFGMLATIIITVPLMALLKN